jgi:GAF domain-containing protein
MDASVAAMEALRQMREELVEKERLATGLAAQMQALVRANLAITTELSPERVLARIAEAGLEVVGARYSALGVIDESGTGLGQFIVAGIDPATRAAIGALPAGRGILGLLMRERRPLRLPDLSSHPQAAGFPPHHPRMTSFLGVPVIVRHRAYGNLYFTDKQGADEFSETDEAAAQMLAAQAGIAIENAQTFRALQEAQEELVRKERLATLGQLAAGVSHEPASRPSTG